LQVPSLLFPQHAQVHPRASQLVLKPNTSTSTGLPYT
jgi:hypothetical protein